MGHRKWHNGCRLSEIKDNGGINISSSMEKQLA